jgi:hypothetical protein
MRVGKGRGLKMERIKHLKNGNGKVHSAGGQSAISLEFCSAQLSFLQWAEIKSMTTNY